MSDGTEEQIEINAAPAKRSDVYGEQMDEAARIAMENLGIGGEDGPTPEQISEAKRKAAEMLENMTPEDTAGLRDLKNLQLSIALPAIRRTLAHMLVASGAKGKKKEEMKLRIANISPMTESGCLNVQFVNILTGKPDTAYLRLEQCPAAHNLTQQLNKLQTRVTPEIWEQMKKHIGVLVTLGRNIYAVVIKQQLPLIRAIWDLSDTDDCAAYTQMKIDPSNTTLYVNSAWPHRIGIFITIDSDTPGGLAASMAAAAAKKQ